MNNNRKCLNNRNNKKYNNFIHNLLLRSNINNNLMCINIFKNINLRELTNNNINILKKSLNHNKELILQIKISNIKYNNNLI